MKKTLAISIIIIICSTLISSAQNHWAQRIWAAGFDIGFGVTSDNSGNIYSVGVYQGSEGHFGTIIIPNS